MKVITRYCLKKKSSYFAPETTTPGYILARKGKTDQKCVKYYPTAPTFYKSTGNHFYFMQCVCVHAWSFFRQDIYWIPKEYSVAHVLGATGG